MNKTKTIISLMTILIFILSLLTAVSTSIFDHDFYKQAQEKYNVSSKMQITEKEVLTATKVALLYTKGLQKDLTFLHSKEDKMVDLYSKQDKDHMVDVKNLYKTMHYTFIVVGSLFIIFTIILIFKNKQLNIYNLTLLVNQVSIYTVIVAVLITFFAFINFDKFWVFFHKIFFRNDLWLMNPQYDALVNLFPENLFKDLVYLIIKKFFLIFGGINLLAYFYRVFTIKKVKND